MIRRFEEKDAQAVHNLIARTMRETNSRDYSADYIENSLMSLTPDRLIERARHTHFYVVCDGDAIVGCGAVGPYWGKEDESSRSIRGAESAGRWSACWSRTNIVCGPSGWRSPPPSPAARFTGSWVTNSKTGWRRRTTSCCTALKNLDNLFTG